MTLKGQEAEVFLQEAGKSGSVMGLETIRSLMKEFSDIQEELRVIHVAGTNGKGSVCTMLSAILIESGYKVGMYTSPAVFGREEQYQINGVSITKEEFAEIIGKVKAAYDRLAAKAMPLPTIFEIETAAAFLYFHQKRCDYVVLETGLGGSLDATNIIEKPLLSVLTSISRDHMGILGQTLEEIAAVKAGIVKQGVMVAAVKPESCVRSVIERECTRKNTSVVYADQGKAADIYMEDGYLCFSYGDHHKLRLSMTGIYQIQNAVCTLEAVKLLKESGLRIGEEQLRKGLEQAHWEGRFSVVSRNPFFVIDGAHNEAAAKKLRQTLEMNFTNYKIIYIIGVLADKEYHKILQIMLPLAEKVYTITPGSERALSGLELASAARKYHADVTYVPDIAKAVLWALEGAEGQQSVVVAFGSLSYLGEVKAALKERTKNDR